MSKSLDPRPVERDPLDGIIVFASGGKNNTQNGGQSGEPITVLWPPPANGIIPSPPDTAVDECPPLVSSEDEETEWARNNGGFEQLLLGLCSCWRGQVIVWTSLIFIPYPSTHTVYWHKIQLFGGGGGGMAIWENGYRKA